MEFQIRETLKIDLGCACSSVACASYICMFVAATLISSSCARGPSISDGVYFGYEPMCNLSPEEDPYAQWFHANVLTVQGDHLTIKKAPRYLTKGKVIPSASDGAFFTYSGNVLADRTRTIVAMRMTDCDYCARRMNGEIEENPSEYVVKYVKDGSFEIDHVRYRRQKDSHFEPKPDS